MTVAAPKRMSGLHEMVHFALGNRKLVFGLSITLAMLLFALIGPMLAHHPPLEYGGKLSLSPTTRDGYWFGTTLLGQDVYAQFVNGLRLAFIVGAIGGGIAAVVGMLVGFTAGYKSGWIDEVLNMLTNVVLVIPTFALLLVIAAYLKVRGIMTESIFIGLTSWPWAARALRAQTFSLTS
ncbi:MAG: ABC transporter permease, partial [Gaiellaceae bacterium]